MASGPYFFDGGQHFWDLPWAAYVEYHVSEAEARWQGNGAVSLPAKIVLAQLLDGAPTSISELEDQHISPDEFFNEINRKLPEFLDFLLEMTGPNAETRKGSPLRVITAFTLTVWFGDWLRRNCQCAPH